MHHCLWHDSMFSPEADVDLWILYVFFVRLFTYSLSCNLLLQATTSGHYSIGLKILDQLVSEMNQVGLCQELHSHTWTRTRTQAYHFLQYLYVNIQSIHRFVFMLYFHTGSHGLLRYSDVIFLEISNDMFPYFLIIKIIKFICIHTGCSLSHSLSSTHCMCTDIHNQIIVYNSPIYTFVIDVSWWAWYEQHEWHESHSTYNLEVNLAVKNL